MSDTSERFSEELAILINHYRIEYDEFSYCDAIGVLELHKAILMDEILCDLAEIEEDEEDDD